MFSANCATREKSGFSRLRIGGTKALCLATFLLREAFR
jgi:hypothetical protein